MSLIKWKHRVTLKVLHVIYWCQGLGLLVVMCGLWDLFVRCRKLYNKKSAMWSLYIMKEDKDYCYIPELQRAIIGKRLSMGRGLPRRSQDRPEDPRRHGLLAGVPAPTMQELLDKQSCRGAGKF